MWDRFWSKVDIREPWECWPWTAYTQARGYGMFLVPKGYIPSDVGPPSVSTQAHRVAYRLTWGEIPDKGDRWFVTHGCHNRSCCNPGHLVLGSPSDNRQDGIKGQKLDWPLVRAMRDGYRLGKTKAALAREYDVSWRMVQKIITNQSWRE